MSVCVKSFLGSHKLQCSTIDALYSTGGFHLTTHGYHCDRELSPLQFKMYCCVRELKSEQCAFNSSYFEL